MLLSLVLLPPPGRIHLKNPRWVSPPAPIVFGPLATPSEASAVGGFGGFLLAAAYRYAATCARRRISAPVRGKSDPGHG